jgi:hypothetical protein
MLVETSVLQWALVKRRDAHDNAEVAARSLLRASVLVVQPETPATDDG